MSLIQNRTADCLRKIFGPLVFVLCSFPSFGQPSDLERIFSNAHAITRSGDIFCQVEGYFISTKIHYVSFNERGYTSIMRQYFAPPNTKLQTDTSLTTNKFFERSEARNGNTVAYSKFYIVPYEMDVMVIAFVTDITRDPMIEHLFAQAIIAGTLPDYVYTSEETDSLKLAGRDISVPGLCTWMKPHNLNCMDKGQMNWAEFRSFETAHESLKSQLDANTHIELATVLSNDSVPVLFEEVNCFARKVVFEAPVYPAPGGIKETLIVYYLVAEVRGKYVSCTMSYYPDQLTGEKLPPFLAQFLKLRD